jgi:hypothetical protein
MVQGKSVDVSPVAFQVWHRPLPRQRLEKEIARKIAPKDQIKRRQWWIGICHIWHTCCKLL